MNALEILMRKNMISHGLTVPTDAMPGYPPGSIFIHTDGSGRTSIYINQGSLTSCNFDDLASVPIADAGSYFTATTVEAALQELALGTCLTPGTGISTGTGTVYWSSVRRFGANVKTEILIDLTGLNSGVTIADIIGVDDTANCHIGLISAAINGTIKYGQLTCLETPATGDPDVDFYGTVTEATGTQDAGIATLTGEVQLLDNGDWTGAVATPIVLTALPGAGYLYMADGGGTDATYTAGQFLLELWGVIE